MMISLDRFKATFLGKCNSVCLLGEHLPEISVVEDQTPDHNVFFIQPTVFSFTHSFILHHPPPRAYLVPGWIKHISWSQWNLIFSEGRTYVNINFILELSWQNYLCCVCLGGRAVQRMEWLFQLGGVKWLYEEGSLLVRPSRGVEFWQVKGAGGYISWPGNGASKITCKLYAWVETRTGDNASELVLARLWGTPSVIGTGELLRALSDIILLYWFGQKVHNILQKNAKELFWPTQSFFFFLESHLGTSWSMMV